MYLKVREEGGVCWKGPWDKSKKESKVASECGVEDTCAHETLSVHAKLSRSMRCAFRLLFQLRFSALSISKALLRDILQNIL